MAKRRDKRPVVDPEKIALERKRARALCGYMLGAEVDPSRREAVSTATDSDLRELVAENPDHPLVAGIIEALDFIGSGRQMAATETGGKAIRC